MISPARAAALSALNDISTGRVDLPAAVARVRPSLSDERDRALATELVAGTLRWQGQLDALVAHFAKRSLTKLDVEVLHILRLAAYQIVHLDRIPVSAAVNDAVAQTRRARKTSAAGFVNAVLRAIAQQKGSLPLPTPDDGLLYLEVGLSHPRWLASRWLDRLGFDAAAARERFNNQAAPLTLRWNPLKTSAEQLVTALAAHGVELSPARYAPQGFVVTKGNPLKTPLAGSGSFFLQDEASQVVSFLAPMAPGLRVLDACASPGGKTTSMAAAAADHARIVAADVRPARIELLRETVRASGASSIQIVQADLERGLPFPDIFDVVLVDAPCSGLGTIRREADIRWRRREDDLAVFARAQNSMIRNAARTVRPGGTLVYSTCSSEPEENDDVVASFLSDAHSFERIDLRSAGTSSVAELLDDDGFFRTIPEKHGLEAFFGAVLRRVK